MRWTKLKTIFGVLCLGVVVFLFLAPFTYWPLMLATMDSKCEFSKSERNPSQQGLPTKFSQKFVLHFWVDGETVAHEDEKIVEYQGVDCAGGSSQRKWKKYLASNGQDRILLKTLEDGRELYFPIESAPWFNPRKPGDLLSEEKKFPSVQVLERGIFGDSLEFRMIDQVSEFGIAIEGVESIE